MIERTIRTAVLAMTVALFAGSALARPVVPAEKRFEDYIDDLPACDNPEVLDFVRNRFNQKESEYWNTSLEILTYDHPRLIAARPWGADHPPRHYCHARALLNDKSYHDVSYAVIVNAGIIGFDWGVEWCVEGLDRNLAFAPSCQLARP